VLSTLSRPRPCIPVAAAAQKLYTRIVFVALGFGVHHHSFVSSRLQRPPTNLPCTACVSPSAVCSSASRWLVRCTSPRAHSLAACVSACACWRLAPQTPLSPPSGISFSSVWLVGTRVSVSSKCLVDTVYHHERPRARLRSAPYSHAGIFARPTPRDVVSTPCNRVPPLRSPGHINSRRA
jgi:hypothetical protein